LLKANHDFVSIKLMKIDGNSHRPWGKAAAIKQLTADDPSERDYQYRLKQAITNCLRLNANDHDVF
jgi:hypothetical protein